MRGDARRIDRRQGEVVIERLVVDQDIVGPEVGRAAEIEIRAAGAELLPGRPGGAAVGAVPRALGGRRDARGRAQRDPAVGHGSKRHLALARAATGVHAVGKVADAPIADRLPRRVHRLGPVPLVGQASDIPVVKAGLAPTAVPGIRRRRVVVRIPVAYGDIGGARGHARHGEIGVAGDRLERLPVTAHPVPRGIGREGRHGVAVGGHGPFGGVDDASEAVEGHVPDFPAPVGRGPEGVSVDIEVPVAGSVVSGVELLPVAVVVRPPETPDRLRGGTDPLELQLVGDGDGLRRFRADVDAAERRRAPRHVLGDGDPAAVFVAVEGVGIELVADVAAGDLHRPGSGRERRQLGAAAVQDMDGAPAVQAGARRIDRERIALVVDDVVPALPIGHEVPGSVAARLVEDDRSAPAPVAHAQRVQRIGARAPRAGGVTRQAIGGDAAEEVLDALARGVDLDGVDRVVGLVGRGLIGLDDLVALVVDRDRLGDQPRRVRHDGEQA